MSWQMCTATASQMQSFAAAIVQQLLRLWKLVACDVVKGQGGPFEYQHKAW